MAVDDEVIRTALGAGRVEPDPASTVLDRALTSGVRRRRGIVVALAAASVIVVAGGVLMLDLDPDDEIVGVASSPSTPVVTPPVTTEVQIATIGSTAPPTSASVPTSAPTSTVPTPVSAPPLVSPGSVLTPSLPTTLQVGSRSVTVTVDAAAPSPDDALAVGTQGGVAQLWSFPAGPGSVPVSVASVSVGACPVAQLECASIGAYDGRYLWIVLDTIFAGDAITIVDPVELVRADLATGAVELAVMPELPADRILRDIVPVDAGGAVVVAEGGGALRTWQVDASLQATGDSQVPIETDDLLSARISRDGRLLAYTRAAPRDGTSSVRIVDLSTGVEQTVADQPSTYPIVRDWSVDGSRLLIGDRWEDWYDYELLIADGSQSERYSDACYLGDRLAVGLWSRAYSESPAASGAIEVRSREGSVATRVDAPIVGNGLVCLGNGSVATVASELPGDGTVGPETGLVVSSDGTVARLADGMSPRTMRPSTARP